MDVKSLEFIFSLLENIELVITNKSKLPIFYKILKMASTTPNLEVNLIVTKLHKKLTKVLLDDSNFIFK